MSIAFCYNFEFFYIKCYNFNMSILFHERLKELRLMLGCSQAELSNLLNIKQPSYNRWEKGTGEPDIYKLIQLSKIFNVSIDYLTGNENESGIIVNTTIELPNDENNLLNNYRKLPTDLKESAQEYLKSLNNINIKHNNK